jgi:hypothetical protein
VNYSGDVTLKKTKRKKEKEVQKASSISPVTAWARS